MAEAVSGEFGRTKSETKEERKLRNKLLIGFGSLSIGSLAFIIAGLQFEQKDIEIKQLERQTADLEQRLVAAISLGQAGIKFNSIASNENGLVVDLPAVGQACSESISLEYATNNEGWTLGLEQKDAAGNVFDSPKAHDASSVQTLITDLCN